MMTVERADLRAYVEEGLTQRQIARRCGCSQGTVRYWLRFHGLRTRYRAGRESSPEVLLGRQTASTDILKRCAEHGEVRWVLDAQGHYRCTKCRSMGVMRRRRRIKEILVVENGGCCVICGYDRSIAALHFHHVDPDQKRLSVAQAGTSMPIEQLRAEVGKCVLLCSNCHVEVEGGIADLPID
jgi:Homeodomain-like domain